MKRCSPCTVAPVRAGAFHCQIEKGRQSDGPDFAKTIKAFMDSNPYCIVYRFIYLYLS